MDSPDQTETETRVGRFPKHRKARYPQVKSFSLALILSHVVFDPRYVTPNARLLHENQIMGLQVAKKILTVEIEHAIKTFAQRFFYLI